MDSLLMDSATESLLLPVYVLSALVILAILIWTAYLCAKNGRWGWFIAGFLCTPFAWIIGALLGRPRARRRY